jgi:hypothetical protein
MKTLLIVLALFGFGCVGDDTSPSTDAGVDCDCHLGPRPHADASVDATPDAPEVFQPCAEVCPTEELAPWYINGQYVWSYCLPSYQRCDDPSKH